MAINTTVRTFRDLDLNFTRHPATNDVASRVGDQAIIRSVRNLINMSNYDKPFHPEIGGLVRQILFENISSLTAQHLKRAIQDIIVNFEPRVKLRDVVVQAREDSNSFDVSISFYIVNQATPTTINVFLERVR
jgi:phage baseplate assembly protein W